MKEIKLTQDKVALVDDEDYESLNQFKWYASKNRNTYYARRNVRINKTKRTSLLMHTSILKTNKQVDHIDRNGLNNTRSNLREATYSQNQGNKVKQKNASGKYKGVWFNPKKNEYQAYIRIGKKIHLGCFLLEEDAAKAYNEAAIKHFSEFALLNIIKV